MPNFPPHLLTEDHWKWHCVSCCGFSCAKENRFHMLAIASPVHGASLVTRMLSRICGHICNPSQIVCGWYDLQVKKLSRCMILHTCVWAMPVVWKILSMLALGLHCTATRMSISPCLASSHSAFTHGKEPVSFRILCMVSSVSQCGWRWWNCTRAALQFALRKPYADLIFAFFTGKSVRCFDCPTAVQHGHTHTRSD